MGNKQKALIWGLIAILTVVAVVSVIKMNSAHEVTENISEVKSNAEALYASGDVYGAIYEMKVYCQYVSTDIDAKTKLGDWYLETGNENEAYKCYYDAANNKKYIDDGIPYLSVKNKEEIILSPVDEVVMEITPDVRVTKDMKLIITGHNLVRNEPMDGRIEKLEEMLYAKDKGYLTTDWFEVDPEGEYLTMSGGFNTAMWQFKNASGEIVNYAVSTNSYRVEDSADVNVYQMARAAIPEKSAWCRVTYYDKSREDMTASPDEELTIVYGRLPGESRRAEYAYYDIPDLREDEKIIFKNNTWFFVKDNVETPIENWQLPAIERGSYIAIDGTLPGKVSFENSSFVGFEKGGIYSVTFDNNNPSAMGRRGDDAKNLGFNAAVAEGRIALGENHFDNIYPWKDIRLCNVLDGKVVAYEGETGFLPDGRGGDVFVEIPKFYVKRVVEDNLDTISISGVCHEGFETDPAFVTNDGEAEHIYIAAYLTSVDGGGKGQSIADSEVKIDFSANEIKQAAVKSGYDEIDYNALSCIQRLFMVETGLRNSQYLYMGACAYTNERETYLAALESNKKTNCITVSSTGYFESGNSVIIYTKDKFDEGIKRTVKTVIENYDNTQSVYFDGEPINVVKDSTLVAHTVLKNGTARSIAHHTGAMSTARGTVAFKYRNIENLWGNAYVYIDGISINGNSATVVDRNGEVKKIGFNLPASNADRVQSMVKKLGYDKTNPHILLPDEIGNGATSSTYYGDAYLSTGDGDKVLLFGGDWSSVECAGLFAYRSDCSVNEANMNVAGRMMFVK